MFERAISLYKKLIDGLVWFLARVGIRKVTRGIIAACGGQAFIAASLFYPSMPALFNHCEA